ncbi:LarC family nickel insertion protein [Paracoccus sp. PARArs4]|uniref:LarC family nickel insertion protein n=1 Tax=Paracoccus sp. PARArs4 TaxID=2853442 RepID=UPI0024A679DF|nr:LarC family nickel insertion protein [Paracoccus sp. PARArs4]
MRRHLHLDPLGGIAGDMFVAAMLDAFPDLTDRVLADVAAVLPHDAGTARLERGMSRGMSVLRFGLHGGHAHDHHHHHHHDHATTYAALRDRIGAAPLSEGTAHHACAILHLIALAEAAAHDLPLEKVHFHELADWDSLMDVVAAGSIVAALADATWSCAPLPLGGGTICTAHGILPVPAPATARILQGYDWIDDGIGGERVTPTGAAILAHVTGGRPAPTPPGGRMGATGMGAGTRDLPDRPNVLRVTTFDIAHGTDRDRVVQLACDLDDMTGEEIGAATDRLRDMPGVLDLTLLNAQGKKSRPVTRMELLCDPGCAEAVAARMFDLTSTIGIRRTEVARLVLPRCATTAAGMPAKTVGRPGGTTTKIEDEALRTHETLAARRAAAKNIV